MTDLSGVREALRTVTQDRASGCVCASLSLAAQPPAVRDRAERGNRRLHQRWKRFDARDKRPTIAAVAVARELAGWCWSLAFMDEPS
ncbi:hypothetical protein ACFY1L_49855 [Streptomyces sp. NPDC001663]|uniref:hypothetical protein n=1 Tax=Streptomyces sp. NPDC001663 TaxID=3364597 RepID=UPI0036A4AA1C